MRQLRHGTTARSQGGGASNHRGEVSTVQDSQLAAPADALWRGRAVHYRGAEWRIATLRNGSRVLLRDEARTMTQWREGHPSREDITTALERETAVQWRNDSGEADYGMPEVWRAVRLPVEPLFKGSVAAHRRDARSVAWIAQVTYRLDARTVVEVLWQEVPDLAAGKALIEGWRPTDETWAWIAQEES